MKAKRQFISFILTALMLISKTQVSASAAASDAPLTIEAPSAVLIEVSSGEILYEKEAFAHRAPASVTKLMTMLLAAEAVDSGLVKLSDIVTASANAASMGGSQIWLEEGETMSFGEMLKCVTVVSANDCCVAIAEHLAGSEEAFAAKMNERAASLGLQNSHFICCSGLSDSDEHYSCAYDLAIIGRELLKHQFIKDYTTVWTDSIRGGEFGLSNTNKLIYSYNGATGLKTGFTSKAMHCLAASAERNGEEYIAVILGAPSSPARFQSARILLDYAFANYSVVKPENLCPLPPLELDLGKSDCINLCLADAASFPLEKSKIQNLSTQLLLPDCVTAPVAEGQVLGTLEIKCDDEIIREIPLAAAERIDKLSLFDIAAKLLAGLTA